jgi:hypothetical protein
LDRANVVPAVARRYPELYEAFVTCCMDGAKVERLKRLLRKGLH